MDLKLSFWYGDTDQVKSIDVEWTDVGPQVSVVPQVLAVVEGLMKFGAGQPTAETAVVRADDTVLVEVPRSDFFANQDRCQRTFCLHPRILHPGEGPCVTCGIECSVFVPKVNPSGKASS